MTKTLKEKSLQEFNLANGKKGSFYSIKKLEQIAPVSKLPVSIRIVLESVLRNSDGKKITDKDIRILANWNAKKPANAEIPFVVSRIVLQDFTGVPLLVDLAAMRSVVTKLNNDPKIIEPQAPVDLVIDHSVQVDFAGNKYAFEKNLDIEFIRNKERYQFLKWGQQAFDTFNVIPPGIGIVHQVNLEYLAKGICEKDNIYYPDTLVGTDSHTTMINGLGVVAWGVGGIEAEAGMLGQPVYFLTPEVVGVHMTGKIPNGSTATDVALFVTQLLRKNNVVGKFIEFYGEGAENLTLADRATIANMAPEYGATMGFFPIDDESINYLKTTGRSDELCQNVKNYYTEQGLFGTPKKGEIEYSQDIEINLDEIKPSVSGPKRPQDRIDTDQVKNKFTQLLTTPTNEGGFSLSKNDLDKKIPLGNEFITHGSVLIAAITSCTNTSNPNVMVAAGLLAKKANELGMKINSFVKTSLAPGSRIVTDYLNKTNLQKELDKLGFNTVGYGCTTCIGNSGPLDLEIEKIVVENQLISASVLSGNRNFEARIHQNIKANFLMSPPLVIAYALAGNINIDIQNDKIGTSKDGKDIFLKDLWPSNDDIKNAVASAIKPEVFNKLYSGFEKQNPKWNEIEAPVGNVYDWDKNSTYIQNPPFFDDFSFTARKVKNIENARPLGIFGDSVTTDHISPAGAIKEDSPAGKFLIENGIEKAQFNSYGSRRGNDKIMTRGTFANVRIKNLIMNGKEGGYTKKNGEEMHIYDAAQKYKEENIPLIVIAGKDYGMGSSRDWAAKGSNLLGIQAVIATSFERIHRSNLIGMGILPICFKNEKDNANSLKLKGTETYSITGFSDKITPKQKLNLNIKYPDGNSKDIPTILRIDTPIEIEYYLYRGILPFVLKNIIEANS